MDIHIPTLENVKEIPTFRIGKRHSNRPKGSKQQIIGNYVLGKKIGQGSYGRVYEATHLMTQAKVLAKVLPTNRHKTDRSNLETFLDYPQVDPKVENQISIQQSLDHPNIAKIYDVVRHDELVYIFMEYCQKGQLFDFLRVDGPLTHKMAGRAFGQIFSAVKYMHGLGIAHRDIKAQNIVFDDDMNAKLIDFGLAKNYGASGVKEHLKTFCGSPSYNPPEIVKKKRYNGELADVWSLGVSLYAMLEASLPFDAANPRVSSYNIANYIWHAAETSPDEAIELYKGIFVPEKDRMTLEDIQQSSYFQRYCSLRDTRSKRLPLIAKDSHITSMRVKTIEAKRKAIFDFGETSETHRKVSFSTTRKPKKHGHPIEPNLQIFEDTNIRISFTPKKGSRKNREKTIENFFLKPLLIQN